VVGIGFSSHVRLGHPFGPQPTKVVGIGGRGRVDV
jgi:hypothetical protein